jgi:antirestriction protein ArdC
MGGIDVASIDATPTAKAAALLENVRRTPMLHGRLRDAKAALRWIIARTIEDCGVAQRLLRDRTWKQAETQCARPRHQHCVALGVGQRAGLHRTDLDDLLVWVRRVLVRSPDSRYRQAIELRANVRKGEKGSPVVYANSITRNETDTDSGVAVARDIHFLKGYTVFNVEQIDGLSAQYTSPASPRPGVSARIACAECLFGATGT